MNGSERDRVKDSCREHDRATAPGGDSGDGDEHRVDGPVLREQARRRERRYLIWFTVAVLVAVLLSLVIGLVIAATDDTELAALEAEEWALIVGIPLAVMLLVAVLAAAFMIWRRRRRSALFAPSPLWELPTQKQRRELVRALRRGQPIDPAHHDLARRVARDTTQRRGLIWLYVFVAALQGANTMIQDGWGRWFSLASTVCFLALAGYFAWLIHRMEQARQRLGDPATSGPATSDRPQVTP